LIIVALRKSPGTPQPGLFYWGDEYEPAANYQKFFSVNLASVSRLSKRQIDEGTPSKPCWWRLRWFVSKG
jgi:hypothetical protein